MARGVLAMIRRLLLQACPEIRGALTQRTAHMAAVLLLPAASVHAHGVGGVCFEQSETPAQVQLCTTARLVAA